MPLSLTAPAARLALLAAVTVLALVSALSAPAPADASQRAGVQAHLLWSGVDGAEMDRQLDQAKDAGAKVIRVDVGWQTLEEQGKGRYASWYLSKVDSLVAKAEARDLDLLFTFVFTPCWASSAPDSVKQNCSPGWYDRGAGRYPPSNPNDYADALAFMVKRYGNRISAWEVWNEPNLRDFFNTGDPAARYAELLKAAYPAAKAADPNATVLGGSLSESDVDFTRALYAHGIKGNFDAFSIHPYTHDRSPLDELEPRYVRSSFVKGVPAVHDVMTGENDDKPMWLTEFGWSTSSTRGGQPWENGVSESTQAVYTAKAYEQMRNWSYVDVGISYGLVDRGSDGDDKESNFGLLRFDRSSKPAVAAFRDAARGIESGDSTPSDTTLSEPVPEGSSGGGSDPTPEDSHAEDPDWEDSESEGSSEGDGGSDEPDASPGTSDVGSATAAEPTAASPVRSERGTGTSKIRVRTRRAKKNVYFEGNAPGLTKVRLDVVGVRRGRSQTRVLYTRVARSGAFSARLARNKLRSGKWTVTASGVGAGGLSKP
ncbi:MAG: GH39 family glycosyl hydrolase [Thermoleophilaceae bacterium]